MAVGERIIFDEDRFLTNYEADGAISVICENRGEFVDFLRRIELNDRIKPLIDECVYRQRNSYDQDVDGWISIYTSKNGRISATTADECSYNFYPNDYYYKDIIFDQRPLDIDSDELMAFIIGA